MAEYIEREKIYADISRLLICKSTADLTNCEDGWTSAISEAMDVIKNAPTSDVRPERHGHVVWKERHSGGFRTVKCLHEFPDIIKENNISCKHIAKFDDRCTVKEPYCSECGKRLGDFINFCGNCGAKMQEAKMDGKDDKSD